MRAVVREILRRRILIVGIVFLIIAFVMALLSAYPEYRTFGILAAVLAIFGAALAIRGYLSFIVELKGEKRKKG